MTELLLSAATGFITGILAAQLGYINYQWFTTFLLTGGICLCATFFLKTVSRKSFRFVSAIAFFCLGAANLIYHTDTSGPYHLSRLISEGKCEFGSVVEGTINNAPDVRTQYTILPVKVSRIITEDGIDYPVKRGKLYVKVYKNADIDINTILYGNTVRLKEVYIRLPQKAMNPGGFDMQRFLYNQHFYGIASIRYSDQLQVLSKEKGNLIFHSVLKIKRSFLHSIKRTVPYPESSFLGGVLLGLRSGLSTEVKDTFRAAGVSHVLAVSGLHVTIITLFFMALFGLIRVPKTTAAILIICALVIFTLITGARPSTIRALIMNTVALSYFYFRGVKLDRSLLIGIAVAALAILTYNPLVLREAAFLFSFSAVLSLSLLTRPVWNLACRYLRGYFRILLAVGIIITTGICLVDPLILLKHWSWAGTAMVVIVCGRILDKRSTHTIEFRQLPKWISIFAAAQLAIQMGMLPLTALYFKKISISAVMANFIAIPLIGIVVQLGLFACILDQIPLIGSIMALTLNAANWLAIKLFLNTADFFGTHFPYPDISPPDPQFLIPYYIALLALAFHTKIQWKLIPRFRLLMKKRNHPSIRRRMILISIVAAGLVCNIIIRELNETDLFRITFFHPSLFQMGGGNSILVESPNGYNLLIDGGPRRSMIAGREFPLKIGEKVITPALLQLNCRRLNTVVLSSPSNNYIGGLASILGNRAFRIDKLYHSLPFNQLPPDWSDRKVLDHLNDPVLFNPKNRDSSETLVWDIQDIFQVAVDRNVFISPVKENLLLHHETIYYNSNPVDFSIRVISPPDKRFKGRYSSSSNSIVLFITFGKLKILLNSNIDRRAQNYIKDHYLEPVDIMQIPANGVSYAYLEEFISAADPDFAVVSPIHTRWHEKSTDQTEQFYKSLGINTYRTDFDGAITFRSDGKRLWLSTYNSKVQKEFVL